MRNSNEIIASMDSLNRQSFLNPDTTKLIALSDEAIAFTKEHPADSNAANLIYKAADISAHIARFDKAVEYFDDFVQKFPENKQAAQALFISAFLSESQLKKKDKAKAAYKKFLAKYPNHEMTETAKAMLYQLENNLSDDDMVKQFEEQNKEAAH